jgi:cytochrome c6
MDGSPVLAAIETPPSAVPSVSASALFKQECAGCHVNGGNIIRRGKNLKQRALQRYRVDSIEAIATLITNGRGLMSAYGDRLSTEDIDLLANYVWERSQQNWR